MAPRTILYLAPWVDVGGTDRAAVDWFETLDRDRYRALIATTLPSRNRGLARLTPYAEEVWPLPDLVRGDRYPALLLDLIRSRGVELVHNSNSRLGMSLLPEIAALPDAPRQVVQLHVSEEDGFARYVGGRYDRLVDAYSVVGEGVAEDLRLSRVSPSKCHLIRLGVDARGEFHPERTEPVELGPGRFHVLWPARFAEQKDPRLMLEVAAALRERVPGAVVHALGEGPLLEEARAVAERLGGAVRIHPPEREMAPWYSAADAVLLTARFEGVPLVVYESMAMRTPVVAPALSGIAEVADESCARLVEPRDDTAGYVAALMELAADAGLRERLGRTGRERVLGGVTREDAAGRHAELYESLLAA